MDRTITVGDAAFYVRIEGQGSPLLLIHGYPLDHTMWDLMIPMLSARHTVIAPDLRGFGQSTGQRDEVSMQLFADDLAEMLAQLHPGEPVNACGLSMGGYILWQLWRRHSDRLSRLILMDTRAAADHEVQARARRENAAIVRREHLASIPKAMIPKLLSETTRRSLPHLAEVLQETILRQNPNAVAAAQIAMSYRVDVQSWLAEINKPTLVVCGEHDSISPPEEMRQFAEQIRGARFAEIPGAGHLPPLESPQMTCEAILRFTER